ncbi:MAG: four helix bundle protein [Anaerolineales bacterium]
MPTAERFEDLDVWQRSRKLANLVYDMTDGELFKRDFVLRDQIRRASVSVMSNIAEGFESKTQAMFIEYLGRAKASAGELRAQLYLALDRNYIDEKLFEKSFSEAQICSRQIVGLSRYLESRPNMRRVREEGASYDVE